MTVSEHDLGLISPMFSGGVSVPSKVFRVVIEAGMSNIDGEYPYEGTILGYDTWRGMAEECGKSRIYGGIHTQCANVAGLVIGDMIGNGIMDMYKNIN